MALFTQKTIRKTEVAIIKEARKLIKRKYGFNGYANYPDLYKNLYKEELWELKNSIANLSYAHIERIYKTLPR